MWKEVKFIFNFGVWIWLLHVSDVSKTEPTCKRNRKSSSEFNSTVTRRELQEHNFFYKKWTFLRKNYENLIYIEITQWYFSYFDYNIWAFSIRKLINFKFSQSLRPLNQPMRNRRFEISGRWQRNVELCLGSWGRWNKFVMVSSNMLYLLIN